MNQPCTFCQIIQNEQTTPVYENDSCIVIPDLYPAAQTHLLIIPKQHISYIHECSSQTVWQDILSAIQALNNRYQEDYKCVINTGPEAGQTIFHLHVHFLIRPHQKSLL